jgi:hypothetical protein
MALPDTSGVKRLTLSFASKSINIEFYAGTPRAELLAGICEVLGVPPTATLRFRNDFGDVAVVSSSMPVSFMSPCFFFLCSTL